MPEDQTARAVQSFKLGTNSGDSENISTFSLVWSRGISQKNEDRVLQKTLETDGVISTRYTCKSPYILLITYDPSILNHSNLHQIYANTIEIGNIDFVLRK